MINIEEIIRQLTGNAETVRALVQSFSDEQAQWKPNPETWSLQQVMEHVYNEERLDFRKHLKEMLGDPSQAWSEFPHKEYVPVEDYHRALEGFLTERKASIAWLLALGVGAPDWEISISCPWGTISTGDVLVSWVDHDFLHIRQMVELLHAWNEKQAVPHSVRYAGGW